MRSRLGTESLDVPVFNVRAILREVMQEFGTGDRDAVAEKTLLRIAPEDREAALLQALREMVPYPRNTESLRERLLSGSEKVGECLIWRGKVRSGYGYISINDTTKRVHRISYEVNIGPIPTGLGLDHLCHTRDLSCPGGSSCLHRACVNPEHLEPVSQAENARRRSGRKGRQAA